MGKATTTTNPTTAVGYHRVSTQKQGASGLGLGAQRDTVANYCRAAGLALVAEYTEIESGRKRNRAQLHAAIADAKARGARLVIAKLDRLARDAAFTMSLRDSGVDFVACDLPDANTLTIGIYASMAQYEAERISERTRAALAEAKRRGTKLGKPANLTPDAQHKSAAANRQNARDAYAKIGNYIAMLRGSGLSLRGIAERLNTDGYRTRTGATFTAATVARIMARNGQAAQ
jgi:DNA invertase Pin-like site-specific DNA recombinase